MRVSALHPFRYSPDGVSLAVAMPGDVIDLDASLVSGLSTAGYIEPLDDELIEEGGFELRHMGRSKYAVFRAGIRLTSEPITKDEGRRIIDEMRSKG